ncbi:MAG: hypothetical protein JEZ10_02540 [Verrucomicrobia bacterium]|nr:hypothetical protein [Verrucomicrobiota bacterium]
MKVKQICHFAPLFLFIVAFNPLAMAAQPTFADLSVLLAKGYFKNHVPAAASLEECAAFLNDHGVCFSLFDLMDSAAVVTPEDFARVVGQSTLIFLGEATVEGGCVKKPLGVDTWVDYCLLNDVDLQPLWSGFAQRIEDAPLVEVQRFFGNSPAAGD